MSHAGHGTRVCEYGAVHGRCRCPSRTVIKIKCPTPEKCAADSDLPAFNAYEPKHRRDDVK